MYMSAASDHIRLANRNHRTSVLLMKAESPHSEWVAVTAFYKSVQMVEAMFADQGIGTSTDHLSRQKTLEQDRFKEVYLPYATLKRASEIARYLTSRNDPKSYTCFAFPSVLHG